MQRKQVVLRNVTSLPARQQHEHKFTGDLKTHETELPRIFP